MVPNKLLEHPKLRKFVKQYPAGGYLFRQGEHGNTMFIVVEGMVELVAETESHSHVAALVMPGGFLGEKAMIKRTGHPRFFSARTIGPVVALEIAHPDLAFLKAAAPELMLDIMVQAFETAIERIENLNFLTRALKSATSETRMAGCLMYLCRTAGLAEGEGLRLGLSEQSFRHYIDATSREVQEFFRKILQAGLVRAHDKHKQWFFVPDRQRLMAYLTAMIDPAASEAA